MEAQEPGNSLAKEVAALKADLVRWVVYQVNEQGRVPEDSALAAEISSKIEAAVERALAARLDAPGNPLETSRRRATEAEQALEALASQSRTKLEGVAKSLQLAESGIDGLARSLDAIEKRVDQLMAKLDLQPEPDRGKSRLPVVSPSPETATSSSQETDPLGALLRKWWVRWLVAPAVAIAILAGSLRWMHVWPFSNPSAPAVVVDPARANLATSLADLRGHIDDLSFELSAAQIEPDRHLATATLEDHARQSLRSALETVATDLQTVRQILRSPGGAGVIRASGATDRVIDLYTGNARNIRILAQAAAALGPSRPQSNHPQGQSGGQNSGPTRSEVQAGAQALLDSVIALNDALAATPAP